MSEVLCGIDFSINCPAMTIKFEDGTFKFFGFIRNNYKLNKKQIAINNKYANENNGIKIISLDSHDTSKVYYERELLNLKDFIYLSDVIINEIKQNVSENDNVIVSIEGLSFGSKGNRLAELASAQIILREQIYKSGYKLFVFSPSSIKLTAGKGNFGKVEMKQAFITEMSKSVQLEDFSSLQTNIWQHPFEDMVDAFFVIKTYERFFKNI